jgi:hypothetical protein
MDPNGGFIQKDERYSADGSFAPASDSAPR